jgi:Spy/CpxP family protein refolding chaperone
MTGTLSPRARAIVISLVLIGFVAGIAAGFAASRALTPAPTIRTQLDMGAVLDELALTPEQRRQADAILERSAPRSRSLMLETAERLSAIADSVDAELRAILSPEQRARLDAMRSDRRMMMKRKIVTPGGTRVDTIMDSIAPRR